ncbi:hypothetical protein KKG36_00405 [Patescibacteria group bacterium]|nr:hypothetical protein [Patescibacteria group bacterium]
MLRPENFGKVIYLQGSQEAIADALNKYGLAETEEQREKKLLSSGIFNTSIMAGLIEELVLGQTKPELLSPAVEKEFNIPKDKAEGLAKEIVENILPLVRSATPEDFALLKKIQDKELEEPVQTQEPPKEEQKTGTDIYREPL